MKERPILFSGEMVRAILEGRKTQTRRIVKGVPASATDGIYSPERDGKWWPTNGNDYVGDGIVCPFGQVDDRLWVREAWRPINRDELDGGRGTVVAYRASCNNDDFDFVTGGGAVMNLTVKVWKPSIHMPRWASRITLEVTGVRVERIQDCSEADAIAEGFEAESFPSRWPGMQYDITSRNYFHALWDRLNAKRGYGWDANPFVWVIEFKKLEVAA